MKARGKPPRRKGHGEARGVFATESEGQAATPQGARDGGKGKGRPTLRLAQGMPMMKLLSYLPVVTLVSYLSVPPPLPRRGGLPLAFFCLVDARARRSLSKTWARGHAARSHGGAPQRLHAAHRDRVTPYFYDYYDFSYSY